MHSFLRNRWGEAVLRAELLRIRYAMSSRENKLRPPLNVFSTHFLLENQHTLYSVSMWQRMTGAKHD